MRRMLAVFVLLALCCAGIFLPAAGFEVEPPPGKALLVEVVVESRGEADWLSRFNVRLAARGVLLLEIGPGDEALLRARGLDHAIVGEICPGEPLYCCPLTDQVPDELERLWSCEGQAVQVLRARAGQKEPSFEGHAGVSLPLDACATNWFRAPAPQAADGRRAGDLARQVAAVVTGESIEAIIDDLTYDASAGTLLTRYSFRDETADMAMPYLRQRLEESLGAHGSVELQEFPLTSGVDPVLAYNVIGTLKGDMDGAGYYVISAHYDAIAARTEGWDGMRDPAPGADDNASGVAGVLECARALAPVPLDFHLKFILFSGEEQGIKGSSYFVDNLVDPSTDGPLLGVINLDMIAYNPAGDTLEIVADPMSAWIADFIVESYAALASEVGDFGVSSVEKLRYPFSDDGAFQVKGYPAVTCIEKRDVDSFYPHYHTVDDNNVDRKLNIGQATKTAKLIAGALAALAARPDAPDLEVLSTDIVFSAPPFPVVRRADVGDTVTISVRVRNVGGSVAADGPPDTRLVNLKLYDGDPEFGAPLIAEDGWTDPLPSMGGVVFRATWVPGEGDRGSHRITAVASLTSGGGDDADPSNNRARATFAVVADQMDLLEDYVFPNPADPGGQASLHYFLTQPAAVIVDVFDAKGRRVGGMTRKGVGGRVPGVNFMEIRVPMKDVLKNFSKLSAGVYFYRIAAEDDVARVEKKGRFIIVR